ncbi:tripartite motif-containing protein 75-like isoform X3 [Crassostrea angulata]|uniref:tripartite motif-containing protein 75-like isoform X3 n=1 Tax=Magallana angulata TaxID=2784310 RepID=UPI0022B18A67|nr:tripartite motif-containing protein 75-like isoform X3 [Crassostrea angulata]
MDSSLKSPEAMLITALQSLNKNFECSICLSPLTDPIITRCEHPFCRSIRESAMLRCIEDSIKAILGSDMKIKDSPSSSPEPSSSTGLTAREPLMLVKVTQKEGQGHGKRRLESDSESDTEEYTRKKICTLGMQ